MESVTSSMASAIPVLPVCVRAPSACLSSLLSSSSTCTTARLSHSAALATTTIYIASENKYKLAVSCIPSPDDGIDNEEHPFVVHSSSSEAECARSFSWLNLQQNDSLSFTECLLYHVDGKWSLLMFEAMDASLSTPSSSVRTWNNYAIQQIELDSFPLKASSSINLADCIHHPSSVLAIESVQAQDDTVSHVQSMAFVEFNLTAPSSSSSSISLHLSCSVIDFSSHAQKILDVAVAGSQNQQQHLYLLSQAQNVHIYEFSPQSSSVAKIKPVATIDIATFASQTIQQRPSRISASIMTHRERLAFCASASVYCVPLLHEEQETIPCLHKMSVADDELVMSLLDSAHGTAVLVNLDGILSSSSASACQLSLKPTKPTKRSYKLRNSGDSLLAEDESVANDEVMEASGEDDVDDDIDADDQEEDEEEEEEQGEEEEEEEEEAAEEELGASKGEEPEEEKTAPSQQKKSTGLEFLLRSISSPFAGLIGLGRAAHGKSESPSSLHWFEEGFPLTLSSPASLAVWNSSSQFSGFSLFPLQEGEAEQEDAHNFQHTLETEAICLLKAPIPSSSSPSPPPSFSCFFTPSLFVRHQHNVQDSYSSSVFILDLFTLKEGSMDINTPLLLSSTNSQEHLQVINANGGISFLVHGQDQQSLLTSLIMLQSTATASHLCSLNGWDVGSLRIHALQLGLANRELHVVQEVLESLTSDQFLLASSMLASFISESNKHNKDDGNEFFAQLITTGLKFMSSVLQQHVHSMQQQGIAEDALPDFSFPSSTVAFAAHNIPVLSNGISNHDENSIVSNFPAISSSSPPPYMISDGNQLSISFPLLVSSLLASSSSSSAPLMQAIDVIQCPLPIHTFLLSECLSALRSIQVEQHDNLLQRRNKQHNYDGREEEAASSRGSPLPESDLDSYDESDGEELESEYHNDFQDDDAQADDVQRKRLFTFERSDHKTALSRWQSMEAPSIILDSLLSGNIPAAMAHLIQYCHYNNVGSDSSSSASDIETNKAKLDAALRIFSSSASSSPSGPREADLTEPRETSLSSLENSYQSFRRVAFALIFDLIRGDQIETAVQMLRNLGEDDSLHFKSLAFKITDADVRNRLLSQLLDAKSELLSEDDKSLIQFVRSLEALYPNSSFLNAYQELVSRHETRLSDISALAVSSPFLLLSSSSSAPLSPSDSASMLTSGDVDIMDQVIPLSLSSSLFPVVSSSSSSTSLLSGSGSSNEADIRRRALYSCLSLAWAKSFDRITRERIEIDGRLLLHLPWSSHPAFESALGSNSLRAQLRMALSHRIPNQVESWVRSLPLSDFAAALTWAEGEERSALNYETSYMGSESSVATIRDIVSIVTEETEGFRLTYIRDLLLQELALRGIFLPCDCSSLFDLLQRLASASLLYNHSKNSQQRVVADFGRLLPRGKLSAFHHHFLEFAMQQDMDRLLESYLDSYDLWKPAQEHYLSSPIATTLKPWARVLLLSRSLDCGLDLSFASADLALQSSHPATVQDMLAANRPLMALGTLSLTGKSILEFSHEESAESPLHFNSRDLESKISEHSTLSSALFRSPAASGATNDCDQILEKRDLFTPQQDISMFEMLQDVSTFDLNGVFAADQAELGSLDFSSSSLEQFAYEESLDLAYFLTHARPFDALHFLLSSTSSSSLSLDSPMVMDNLIEASYAEADENSVSPSSAKFAAQISHQERTSIIETAFSVAEAHVQDASIVEACAQLLILCGLSEHGARLRIDVAAARRILAFVECSSSAASSISASETSAILHSLFSSAEANQVLLPAVLDLLEQATLSEGQKLGLPGLGPFSAASSNHIQLPASAASRSSSPASPLVASSTSSVKSSSSLWRVVTQFAHQHGLPPYTNHLCGLAVEGAWLQFLLEAQDEQVPISSLYAIVEQHLVHAKGPREYIVVVLSLMEQEQQPDLDGQSANNRIELQDMVPVDTPISKVFDMILQATTKASDVSNSVVALSCLKMAVASKCPLLAIIAACLDSSLSVLQCATVWLHASLAMEDAEKADGFDSAVNAEEDLLLTMLSNCLRRMCKLGKMTLVLRCLQIFDPRNSLIELANALCLIQCGDEQQAKERAQQFYHDCADEINHRLGSNHWCIKTAEHLIDDCLDSHKNCRYSRSQVLRVFSSSSRYDRLHRLDVLLSQVNCLDLDFIQLSPEVIVSTLVERSHFFIARQVALLFQLPLHHITLSEADQWVADARRSLTLWRSEEERVRLYSRIEEDLFIKNEYPAHAAGLFFLQRAEELRNDPSVPAKEQIAPLSSALRWFRKSEENQQQEEVDYLEHYISLVTMCDDEDIVVASSFSSSSSSSSSASVPTPSNASSSSSSSQRSVLESMRSPLMRTRSANSISSTLSAIPMSSLSQSPSSASSFMDQFTSSIKADEASKYLDAVVDKHLRAGNLGECEKLCSFFRHSDSLPLQLCRLSLTIASSGFMSYDSTIRSLPDTSRALLQEVTTSTFSSSLLSSSSSGSSTSDLLSSFMTENSLHLQKTLDILANCKKLPHQATGARVFLRRIAIFHRISCILTIPFATAQLTDPCELMRRLLLTCGADAIKLCSSIISLLRSAASSPGTSAIIPSSSLFSASASPVTPSTPHGTLSSAAAQQLQHEVPSPLQHSFQPPQPQPFNYDFDNIATTTRLAKFLAEYAFTALCAQFVPEQLEIWPSSPSAVQQGEPLREYLEAIAMCPRASPGNWNKEEFTEYCRLCPDPSEVGRQILKALVIVVPDLARCIIVSKQAFLKNARNKNGSGGRSNNNNGNSSWSILTGSSSFGDLEALMDHQGAAAPPQAGQDDEEAEDEKEKQSKDDNAEEIIVHEARGPPSTLFDQVDAEENGVSSSSSLKNGATALLPSRSPAPPATPPRTPSSASRDSPQPPTFEASPHKTPSALGNSKTHSSASSDGPELSTPIRKPSEAARNLKPRQPGQHLHPSENKGISFDDYRISNSNTEWLSSLRSSLHPSAELEAELLIRAYWSFEAQCAIQGIDVTLTAVRERAPVYVDAGKFQVLVRLLTGIGNYTSLSWIFDILMMNDQFEMILRRTSLAASNANAALAPLPLGRISSELQEQQVAQQSPLNSVAVAPTELKLVLSNYLQAHDPDDVDRLMMVYLRFGMYLQLGGLLIKKAADQVAQLPNIIPSPPSSMSQAALYALASSSSSLSSSSSSTPSAASSSGSGLMSPSSSNTGSNGLSAAAASNPNHPFINLMDALARISQLYKSAADAFFKAESYQSAHRSLAKGAMVDLQRYLAVGDFAAAATSIPSLQYQQQSKNGAADNSGRSPSPFVNTPLSLSPAVLALAASSPTSRSMIVKMNLEEAKDFMLSHPVFHHTLIVAEAFERNLLSEWVDPLFTQSVSKGNVDYLRSFTLCLPTPPALYREIIHRYVRLPISTQKERDCIANMKQVITHCDDLSLQLEMARELKFDDLAKSISKSLDDSSIYDDPNQNSASMGAASPSK